MTNTPQKEALRGKILHYLALIYPQAADLSLLQAELDLVGYPVPMDELNLHLAYLSEKKLIIPVLDLRAQRRGPSVRVVKITAKGIDYYDGRLPADPGIYVEPK